MPETTYCISARGRRESLVLDPSDWQSIAEFPTRKAARAYADEITPSMPSKDLPLRVIVFSDELREKSLRARDWRVEQARAYREENGLGEYHKAVQRAAARSMADQGYTVTCQGETYSPKP